MSSMLKQKFLNQYQQTSIETGLENATPHKLVGMLYDGILGSLASVKGSIEHRDYELKAKKINHIVSMVGGLVSGLDMERGGEVAENYAALYAYINRRLIDVNLKNDLEILSEVTGLVRDMRDNWNAMPDDMKSATKQQLDALGKNG